MRLPQAPSDGYFVEVAAETLPFVAEILDYVASSKCFEVPVIGNCNAAIAMNKTMCAAMGKTVDLGGAYDSESQALCAIVKCAAAEAMELMPSTWDRVTQFHDLAKAHDKTNFLTGKHSELMNMSTEVNNQILMKMRMQVPAFPS